jgi:trehalose/maltose hydrolase-like predicted phosphorylase
MAGTVDLLQRGYSGLEARGEALRFNPAIPPEIGALEYELHYRGHRLQVRITHDRLTVGAIPTGRAPIRVGCRDDVIELAPGATAEWDLGTAGPSGGAPPAP